MNKEKAEYSEKLEESRKHANLQLNCDGIYKCKDTIQGFYPIYLTSRLALSKKIIISFYNTWGSSLKNVKS